MIYSRSAEYAIRAFVHMAARTPDEFVLTRSIADETGVPAHFLSKILQDLVRRGFLKSSKGPHGGFQLARPPSEISLVGIVRAVDGPARLDRCIAGHSECHDEVPCAMHDSWTEVRSRIIKYLEETSIADLSDAFVDKRRRLTERRRTAAKVASARKR